MPNLGTYGLDPMGGGVATAQNEPINVPSIGSPDMSFGGDMQEFMKKALMEQYERKKREQDMLQAEQNRALQMRAQAERVGGGIGAASHAGRGSSGEAPPDIGGLGSLQRSVQADEMQSALSGPQVRYVTGGPGIIGGGLTLDTMKMNAGQRKLYMPSGSGFESNSKQSAKKKYDPQTGKLLESEEDADSGPTATSSLIGKAGSTNVGWGR